MGDSQYPKAGRKDRIGRFGLVKPTLEHPDVILEKYAPEKGAKRDTKYLFVKSFVKTDGSRIINFESVTVLKEGNEVSISTHEIDSSKVEKELRENKMLWNRFSGDSNSLGENQGLAITQSEQDPNRTDSGLNPHSDGKVTDNIREKQEKSENSAIQGLENYSEKDVTDLVSQHFNDLAGDTGVEIVDMKVIGSRTKGKAKDDSDLDVLLEYKGDMKEDDLFNLLNDEENKLYIEGIPVDINPITKGKSGTIEQWMKRNDNYEKEGEESLKDEESLRDSEKKERPLQEMPLKSSDRFNGEHIKGLEEYEEELRKEFAALDNPAISGRDVPVADIPDSSPSVQDDRRGTYKGVVEEVPAGEKRTLESSSDRRRRVESELTAIEQEKEDRTSKNTFQEGSSYSHILFSSHHITPRTLFAWHLIMT
jgi:predicted nucleotidyltransferase